MYNSVVATFCYQAVRGLPLQVHNASTVLRLSYIDDVVAELTAALLGGANEKPDGFCYVPAEYQKGLGQIADLLTSFQNSRLDGHIPDMGDGFTKKLYATYLSYLPETAFAYPLNMHTDSRGSFTELLRSADRGQVSVNVCRPGVTKGDHWHQTKHEKFIVVSGEGCIRLRKVGANPDTQENYPVAEIPVSGRELKAVDIPPGYTHQIVNTGQTDLVTVIWCNELWDKERPDTYYECV